MGVFKTLELQKENKQGVFSRAAQASTPKQNLLSRASDFAEKHLVGGKIGSAIGNTLGGVSQAAILLGQGKGTQALDTLKVSADQNGKMFSRVAGDTAQAVLTPASLAVSAPASLLARIAQGSGFGAALSATNSIAQGGNTKDVLKSTAIGGAIGGAIPLAGAGIRQFGKLLGKTGDKIQLAVIKPTAADIKDGFSIETVKRFNLGGSLKTSFTKTDEALDNLSKQLNNKLNASSQRLNLQDVLNNTVKRVTGSKLENFGSNTSMENALNQLKAEIGAVEGVGGVSIPEAQLIKRASGHYGAWLYGAADPESTARQKVYNTFYNEIKNEIEKRSPEGVRAINKQISELIPVMNALIRRIPVAERNNAISLTDIITLSAASLEPRAFALSLMNLASKSGTVGSALSRFGGRIQNAGPAAGNLLRTATAPLGSQASTVPPQPISQSRVSSPNTTIDPRVVQALSTYALPR